MNAADFMANHGWELLTMAVLLVCSAFVSGTETALFSLARGQLHKLGQGGPAGRLVVSLMNRPRRVLNTLLLANLIINTAYATIAAGVVFDINRAGGALWATLLISIAPLIVLILIGEVSPKLLCMAIGESWALVAAPVVTILERLLLPLVWTLEFLMVRPCLRMISPRSSTPREITGGELAETLDLSAKRGLIDHDTNMFLQSIMELTEVRVGRIMVPRVDMTDFNVEGRPEELVELFRRTRHRRIPVYERDTDHILGVVHSKRFFLNPGQPLRKLIDPIPFVPEAARVEKVLLQLRVTRSHLAIVVDEYGGTAGLVGLKDIVERIVGDIPEYGQQEVRQAVTKISQTEYLLDGDLAIHEWLEAFDMDLSGQRISTVGGFVMSLRGGVPHNGDVVNYRNLRFTVHAMRGRRVGSVLVQLRQGMA
ncbi:MAG: HlyC/CorC family transporter [Planctomycetes bacterium]|nr:HlyC/CorC family transporter [Planctomycetota bacterium]